MVSCLIFVSAKADLIKNTSRYISYYTASPNLVYARSDLFSNPGFILAGEDYREPFNLPVACYANVKSIVAFSGNLCYFRTC